MLWLNCIMDSFAALALATDPPSDKLLDRPPNKKFERIITPFMWKTILWQSLCQFIFLMLVLAFSPRVLGFERGGGNQV